MRLIGHAAVRVLAVTVAFAAPLMVLRAVASRAYELGCPGVPDAGTAPLALVPWLFWGYRSGDLSIWTSSGMFITWFMSLAIFVLPAGLSAAIAHGMVARWTLLLFACTQVVLAGASIWSWRMSFFFETPYSRSAGVMLLAVALMWPIGLASGGIAVGFAVQKQMRSRRRQSAPGIEMPANPALQPPPPSRRG